MKRIFLLFLLAIPFTTFAQSTEKDAIQERLQAYYEANENKDWETVVDMLYPPLVEMASREALVQMFADLEGNGMVFNMQGFETKSISPTYTHEGQRYAKVAYQSDLSLQFTSEAFAEPNMVEILRNNFADEYGAENVEHEAESNTFTIHVDKFMLANQGKAESDLWTFMELDEKNPLASKLIPEAVNEHFKAGQE
jgi:hypothetical protein